MNLKVIIASLVLGSSSVAMAAPRVTFSANAQYGATVVRDHRAADPNCDPVSGRPYTQPVYTQPVYTQPVYTQPVYTQPVYTQPVYTEPEYTEPVYTQPEYTEPVYTQPVYGEPSWHRPTFRPVTLASGLHFSNDGRTFIAVGNQAGRFDSLQISAAGGRTFIQQVYVQFDNGQEQIVRNVNQTLTGNESVTLDLDGNRRAIRRIVVYGNDLNNGWRSNGWRSNGLRHGLRHNAGAFTVTAA